MSAKEEKELMTQMKQRLQAVQASKEANANKGKKLDEKLRLAFKNPPKRPNISVEKIQEEMDKLELRRTTVSMSLNDEKYILRELQLLKEKKSQVEEYQSFQVKIDEMKKERNDCWEQNKAFEEQLNQMANALKKITLAQKLQCSAKEFVTIEINVPKDKMGNVIGKGSAKLQQIEKECGVLLEMEDKLNLVRITSTPGNTLLAKESIENITLAEMHTIGLHPDTIKVLMFQKSKNLQEIEQTLGLRIDISKKDGVLTVTCSPVKAKLLEKTLKELTEGKEEIILPAEIVPKLIGKKGETINQLMEDTGALFDIDKVSNTVSICGTKEAVDMAKKFVLDLIESQSQREREFRVTDRRFFSQDFEEFKFGFFAEFLMSNKAQQLKILRMDASDAKIKIVKSPPNERMIHVIGNKAQLNAMEEALRERLREFENHHWVVDVEPHVLSVIIGKRGSKMKQIEQEASGLAPGKPQEPTTTRDGKDNKEDDNDEDQSDNTSSPSKSKNTNKKPSNNTASKKSNLPVHIEIEGTHVCVFGETSGQIEKAKQLITEIIDQNQRSSFLTSEALVAVLMSNKRVKLNEIEKSSGCNLKLPPPPSSLTDAKKKDQKRFRDQQQVEIVLSGTSDAISRAKTLLEELQDANMVRYLPLDADEVPTVIGKKGETISQLEENSGARLRVVQMASASVVEPTEGLLIPGSSSSNPAELEMIGTEEQLKSVKEAIDVLLQIQNREILQLDPFATGCLIGKKGERIKALRQDHPEATIDAFPAHGQVRIKASNSLALQNAVDAILQFLRDTPVVETIKVSSDYEGTFHTLLKDQPMLRKRLDELEAEGGEGMKVTISDDGKSAKVRGPALGIGNVKQFLDMLLTNAGKFFHEHIQLPTGAFTTALTASTSTPSATDSKSKSKSKSKTAAAAPPPPTRSDGLNDNGVRIAKQFHVDIRIKASSKSIRIEGKKPENVLQAKEAVHQMLQFYFSNCFHLVDKLPLSLVPRLYSLLPMWNKKFQACFTLVDATSIQVFTDSAQNTQRVVQAIQEELVNWRKLHVELTIASWIVPILVGKNGESIKKLSTESGGAKLDLTPVNSNPTSYKLTSFGNFGTNTAAAASAMSGDRLLMISGTSEEVVNKAKQAVTELIKTQEKFISTVQVPKNLADLVLAIKREASAGINFSVVNGTAPVSGGAKGKSVTPPGLSPPTPVRDDVVTVQIYGQNDQERKKIAEKMQKLAKESVIEKILLPSSSGPTGGAVVGALIGAKGANIRALQKEFPKVLIDIRSEENVVELKGSKEQVIQVKNVMEDKVKELVTLQLQYQQRRGGPVGATGSTTVPTTKENPSTAAPEDDEQEEEVTQDENAGPNPVPGRSGPVPGAPVGMVNPNGQKLNKNQRRRMRKRAENEIKSDVLSMLVGSDVPGKETAAAPPGGFEVESATSASSSNGGYYHSSSGYTLRL